MKQNTYKIKIILKYSMEQNYFSLNESSVCYSYFKKCIRKLNNLILSFLYYFRGWKGRRMETNSFPWTPVLKFLLPVQRELANGRMAQPDADTRLTPQSCCPSPDRGLKGQQQHRDTRENRKSRYIAFSSSN